MVTLEVLNDIFRRVFEDNSLVITRSTTANDIEEWDSLTHMNLIMVLEKQFKIKFSLSEIENLSSVGDLVDLIDRKSAKQ
jgi:acyl carrier protein